METYKNGYENTKKVIQQLDYTENNFNTLIAIACDAPNEFFQISFLKVCSIWVYRYWFI